MTLKPEDLPLVGALYQFAGRDRGYNALILCGPLLIAVLALLGRSPVTVALAAGYVSAFVLYTLWKSVELV
jgi:hypothetical protein